MVFSCFIENTFLYIISKADLKFKNQTSDYVQSDSLALLVTAPMQRSYGRMLAAKDSIGISCGNRISSNHSSAARG